MCVVDRIVGRQTGALCEEEASYGRPLSVSGRPCYILPMFLCNDPGSWLWCQFVVWRLSPVNPGRPEWSKVQIRGKPLVATAQATCVSAGE